MELLKLLKALKNAQDIMKQLEENRDLISQLSPAELEQVREQADYDEEEWQLILMKLRSGS